MPKTFSGKHVIKILEKQFSFSFVSQKGSHVKLEKIISGRRVVTIVPLHRELARGTLRGVLDLAEIDEKEFWKHSCPKTPRLIFWFCEKKFDSRPAFC